MFDFNETYDRKNSNCYKWDNNEQVFSIDDASDLLPMWIADMDIATPPFVVDALKSRLEHPIFGYSKPSDSLITAILNWYHARHNWHINQKHLLFHNGVIPALATIIETFSNTGDKVCLASPVYAPFTGIPQNLKREVVRVPLDEHDGIYSYNFDKLAQAFSEDVKIYILCNPHNPAGMVWNRETLTEILQLAKRYNVLVISDEIHSDLVIPPYQHIPLQTLNDTIDAEIITCVAPTKTFNLASINIAMMIASNNALTAKLKQHALMHGQAGPNIFAVTATEAAFKNGAQWVDELQQHISDNMDYVIEACRDIEGLRIIKPQGTYLLWLDYRNMKLSEKDMLQKLLTVGRLGLDPGAKFGSEGDGFLRMNVATPRSTVEDAVKRLHKALL